MFYSQLKTQLSAEDRPQALVNFGAGVAAATAATLLTQPTDVLRTRMQLKLVDGSAGAVSSLAAIIKQQGPAALLTGGWCTNSS